MSEFLSMGGYAKFVWPSFLISLAVLAGIAVVSIRTYREQKAALAALESGGAEQDTQSPRPTEANS